MKSIAFTICSNNYLSQAKVLSDSVYKYSKDDYEFVIVLCDVFSDKIDYDEFHATFVEAKSLGIENFEWMVRYYNIVELNTAIKPFAFKYLISNYNPPFIHYLDPDTRTYTSLKAIEEELNPNSSILLTPHELAPLPFDGKHPSDNTFLNAGIYNLGVLGLRVSDESLKMLDWWCEFLAEHCIIDHQHGFFVDQLPMELVPLFFNEVKVSRHRGINVAYWNLHERSISIKNDDYVVNEKYPLVLYHFSSYKSSKPDLMSWHCDRYEIDTPVLKKLFGDYCNEIVHTKQRLYKSVECEYTKRRNTFFRKNIYRFSYVLRTMIDKLCNKLDRI